MYCEAPVAARLRTWPGQGAICVPEPLGLESVAVMAEKAGADVAPAAEPVVF